jgi:hypothetical protein
VVNSFVHGMDGNFFLAKGVIKNWTSVNPISHSTRASPSFVNFVSHSKRKLHLFIIKLWLSNFVFLCYFMVVTYSSYLH